LSITARQPGLSWARCLTMQAVILGMFGISELQRRNASPVHICRASAVEAKLLLGDQPGDEAGEGQTQTGLPKLADERCGHVWLPLAPRSGPVSDESYDAPDASLPP